MDPVPYINRALVLVAVACLAALPLVAHAVLLRGA
jgi:hypothetical protein